MDFSSASKMAGEWWAERLHSDHVDKKEAFAAAVARLCEAKMMEHAEYYINLGLEPRCQLVVDYDPKEEMLKAVCEVIDPECGGFMFSADGILPYKHTLNVYPDRLEPKEGYGQWIEPIRVK